MLPVCSECGQPIQEGERYFSLVMSEEWDSKDMTYVRYSTQVATYHKQCSPFKLIRKKGIMKTIADSECRRYETDEEPTKGKKSKGTGNQHYEKFG